MSDSNGGCGLAACRVDLVVNTDQVINKAVIKVVAIACLPCTNPGMGLFTGGVDLTFGHSQLFQAAHNQSGTNPRDGRAAGGIGLAFEYRHAIDMAVQLPGANTRR